MVLLYLIILFGIFGYYNLANSNKVYYYSIIKGNIQKLIKQKYLFNLSNYIENKEAKLINKNTAEFGKEYICEKEPKAFAGETIHLNIHIFIFDRIVSFIFYPFKMNQFPFNSPQYILLPINNFNQFIQSQNNQLENISNVNQKTPHYLTIINYKSLIHLKKLIQNKN